MEKNSNFNGSFPVKTTFQNNTKDKEQVLGSNSDSGDEDKEITVYKMKQLDFYAAKVYFYETEYSSLFNDVEDYEFLIRTGDVKREKLLVKLKDLKIVPIQQEIIDTIFVLLSEDTKIIRQKERMLLVGPSAEIKAIQGKLQTKVGHEEMSMPWQDDKDTEDYSSTHGAPLYRGARAKDLTKQTTENASLKKIQFPIKGTTNGIIIEKRVIYSANEITLYIGCTGLEISVHKANITKLRVDCIVNAANRHLKHAGGVAKVISKAAGYDLQYECERYIAEYDSVQVTGVFVSTGGDLPAKHVIHAVGPRWDDYVDKRKCTDDLRRTVLTCLLEATKREMSTIALPPLSAAIFRVPQDLCAEAYMHAVKNYDALLQHMNLIALKEIHFVDINDAMIDSIKKCFTNQWCTEKKCKFFEEDLNFAVAYMKKQSQASQVSRENLPKQDKRGKHNGAIFSSRTDKIGKAAHKAEEDKSVPSKKHPNSERVSSSPNSQSCMVRCGSGIKKNKARKSEVGSDVQLPITVTNEKICSCQNKGLDNLKYSLYTKQDKDELEYSFKIMNVNLGVSYKHAFDFKPDLIITLGDPHDIFSEHSDYHSANLFILDMGEKINNVQSLKLKRSSFVFQLEVDDVNQISLTEAFKNLTQAVNIIKEKVKSIVFTSNFHSKPTETRNKSELDPTVASLFAQHVCEFASEAAKETSPLRAITLTTNKFAIPYITDVFQATNFRVSSFLPKP